jgi:hypothetical protein
MLKMSFHYWYLPVNFICRSNEHSHVKTNMVHTLHRVKGMGSQPIQSLKDILTTEEYKKCASSPYIEKTWYKMTLDVFVAFLFRAIFLLSHFSPFILHCQGSCLALTFASILKLISICHFQQEIAEASDDAARKYYEETPIEDRSDATVTVVMRAAARSKQQSFKGQFAKYLAIANLKFGDKFLEEVSFSIHTPLQCILIQYWLMNNIPCYSSLQQLLLLHLSR